MPPETGDNMKKKKIWISYLVAVAVAVAIALMAIGFEIETYGKSSVLLLEFFSDGFFTSAVLYLGCGILVFIEEAGNFYGIQYLCHWVLRMFSFRKDRFESRKTYFEFCREKKAKQEDQGKSSLKWILLFVGLGCLVLSIVFLLVYYQIGY